MLKVKLRKYTRDKKGRVPYIYDVGKYLWFLTPSPLPSAVFYYYPWSVGKVDKFLTPKKCRRLYWMVPRVNWYAKIWGGHCSQPPPLPAPRFLRPCRARVAGRGRLRTTRLNDGDQQSKDNYGVIFQPCFTNICYLVAWHSGEQLK